MSNFDIDKTDINNYILSIEQYLSRYFFFFVFFELGIVLFIT